MGIQELGECSGHRVARSARRDDRSSRPRRVEGPWLTTRRVISLRGLSGCSVHVETPRYNSMYWGRAFESLLGS